MRRFRSGDGSLHGYASVGVSRYLALYTLQGCWIMLGAYLLTHAYWPSTCSPHDMLQVYGCSYRLPESRSWVAAGLLTWLWSTPILVAMEILRRFNKPRR